MYCIKCGKQIEEKESKKYESFCKDCYKNSEKYKSKTKKIGIGIIIIILLSILISLIFNTIKNTKEVSSPNNENHYGNEPYNMTAYSNNFLKYGDWIIFSNGSQLWDRTVENYEDGIYKYNIKTGQVIKLYNYNGYCLNLKNDDLYFCNEDGWIRIVNLNSLKESWISSIDIDDANYLMIYNDEIFYRSSNGNNIYKYNTSNDSKDLVAEYTENEFQIYNDNIFYIDAQTHQLFKKSVKKEEKPIKILEKPISNFYVTENKIIYLSSEKIKALYIDTNTSEVLEDNICSNFVLKDNKVYAYSSKESSIKEIDIDTKEAKVLIKDSKEIYRLQIFDNNIFYYHTTSNYLNTSTQLYYVDIDNKQQEKLFFKTN